MFERFTDRARRVVVLAQEEARLLHHGYIGTEHLLLGLIREDQGVAAKALKALDIELQAVRDRVREICGEGDEEERADGHIPFTPRAKLVLEMALREALELQHSHIGTEHILLGLIREGQGVGAQVLLQLGADLNRVRQEVMGLVRGVTGTRSERGGRHEPPSVTVGRRAVRGRMERTLVSSFRVQLREIEARLSAVEQRVGFGPDVSEAQKAANQGEWAAAHPDLAALAEAVERLDGEVGRLRRLLMEHGIDPGSGEQGGAE